MSRRRYARRRRGGYVLVIFAMMSLGLLGLAAVVIDLGLARATQAQMQSAADAAALEGLRGRDALDDADRRQLASDLVARRFDAELDLDSTNDALSLGAGPLVGHDAGLGAAHGAQLLTIDPASRAYDPVLELNLGDDPRGDLVAGDWLADVDPSLGHGESATYARADFVERGSATVAAEVSSAFLARLRRTPNLDGDDVVPGVSSSGPALPLLFGLGAAIHEDDDPATVHDPRAHGITVRATAIADGRPVVAVGQRDDPAGVPWGLLPFSLSRAAWASVPDAPASTPLVLDGVSASSIAVASTAGLTAVGDPRGSLAVLDATIREGDGYAAITDPAAGDVVVGFGWVVVGPGPGIGRRRGAVAPQNATAVPGPMVTPAYPLTPATLLQRVDGVLRAPALVR